MMPTLSESTRRDGRKRAKRGQDVDAFHLDLEVSATVLYLILAIDKQLCYPL